MSPVAYVLAAFALIVVLAWICGAAARLRDAIQDRLLARQARRHRIKEMACPHCGAEVVLPDVPYMRFPCPSCGELLSGPDAAPRQ